MVIAVTSGSSLAISLRVEDADELWMAGSAWLLVYELALPRSASIVSMIIDCIEWNL